MADEVFLSTNFDEMSFAIAKEEELESWKRNNVFTEVTTENQPHVACRWVITIKEVNGSHTTKARLITRGFEDRCEESENRFSNMFHRVY